MLYVLSFILVMAGVVIFCARPALIYSQPFGARYYTLIPSFARKKIYFLLSNVLISTVNFKFARSYNVYEMTIITACIHFIVPLILFLPRCLLSCRVLQLNHSIGMRFPTFSVIRL